MQLASGSERGRWGKSVEGLESGLPPLSPMVRWPSRAGIKGGSSVVFEGASPSSFLYPAALRTALIQSSA